MNEFIEIKILNWGKYQQRTSGYKNCWWFSFSNTFFSDSKIWVLDPEEKIGFIYLLCEASKQGKDTPFIAFKHAEKCADIKPKKLLSTIKKLEQLNMVATICTDAEQGLSNTEQNRTEQNTTKHYFLTDEMIDEFYSNYPKKVQKASGNAKLKKIIKNETDLENFKKALANYVNLCQKENREQKFIKGWGSFVNQHLDFLDMEISPQRKKKNLFLEQFEKGGTDV